MGTITRRLLLSSVGAVALGGLTYGGSRVACRFVPRNHPDFFSLIDGVPDTAITRRIGALALGAGSVPGDLRSLASTLSERPLVREALGADCPTIRKGLVQDACAADFADRRTVLIDGWVLSETEAALCAAKALV